MKIWLEAIGLAISFALLFGCMVSNTWRQVISWAIGLALLFMLSFTLGFLS